MRHKARGFTLVEMCVAMGVMGIVMTVAAMEFKTVVYTHLFETSHMSAEQQARVAMAKIAGISRQASVVDNQTVGSNPTPAVTEPSSTAGPRFVFTQVACLGTDPKCLPVSGGVPAPCYNKVQLYLQNTVGAVGGTLWEQAEPFDAAGGPCPSFDYSRMPLLIARNVEDFSVTPIPNNTNKLGYQNGYRVDLTIYGYDDHSIDSRAGASYHLQTVITPIVFGESL